MVQWPRARLVEERGFHGVSCCGVEVSAPAAHCPSFLTCGRGLVCALGERTPRSGSSLMQSQGPGAPAASEDLFVLSQERLEKGERCPCPRETVTTWPPAGSTWVGRNNPQHSESHCETCESHRKRCSDTVGWACEWQWRAALGPCTLASLHAGSRFRASALVSLPRPLSLGY